jgi:hypothetical protein
MVAICASAEEADAFLAFGVGSLSPLASFGEIARGFLHALTWKQGRRERGGNHTDCGN